LDISLAKKGLGWAPTIYLEEGIARLAQWLMKRKNNMHM
jgi:nucleoside-diphosphate-sugar epimerase